MNGPSNAGVVRRRATVNTAHFLGGGGGGLGGGGAGRGGEGNWKLVDLYAYRAVNNAAALVSQEARRLPFCGNFAALLESFPAASKVL